MLNLWVNILNNKHENTERDYYRPPTHTWFAAKNFFCNYTLRAKLHKTLQQMLFLVFGSEKYYFYPRVKRGDNYGFTFQELSLSPFYRQGAMERAGEI